MRYFWIRPRHPVSTCCLQSQFLKLWSCSHKASQVYRSYSYKVIQVGFAVQILGYNARYVQRNFASIQPILRMPSIDHYLTFFLKKYRFQLFTYVELFRLTCVSNGTRTRNFHDRAHKTATTEPRCHMKPSMNVRYMTPKCQVSL